MSVLLDNIKKKLCDLSNKKNIVLRERGNHAIRDVLKLLRKNYDKLYIQDQGGWITYKQYGDKLKYKVNYIKSNYGIVEVPNLTDIDNKSVVLINSMPAYHAFIDTKKLYEYCKRVGSVLVIDVSGSIGEQVYGHIIVGSFGRWKPIDLGKGGFIGYDDFSFDDEFTGDLKELNEKINRLNERRRNLFKLHDKIVKELKNMDFNVLNPDKQGFNVLIRCKVPQKLKIVKYCIENNLEYVECPKYIKMNEEGISIEVKRK